MKPSIGRIVHVVMNDGRALPAIITQVLNDERLDLVVFGIGTAASVLTNIAEDFTQVPKPWTWHWPPREKDSVDLRPKEFGIANQENHNV